MRDTIKLKVNYASKDIKRLEYVHDGDSGLDFRAYTPEDIIVKAGDVVVIPTGIRIGLPVGYEMAMRSKSGLASKQKMITVLGTIEYNYTGYIGVILHNTTKEDYIVKNGDKVGQGVPQRVTYVEEFIEVDNFEETNRGSNGFGSSGLR